MLLSSNMIAKPSSSRPIASFLLPFTHSTSSQVRCLHHTVRPSPIPEPTPFVPDAQTFLTLIGRGSSRFASRISSWQALFSLSGPQLKDLGVEPVRSRRYLLQWREKFRQGQFGPGGNLKHVKDGVAVLRILETDGSADTTATATLGPRKKKVVANVPAEGSAGDAQPYIAREFKIKAGNVIQGPWVQQCKGRKKAQLVVTEGMWEDRQGVKIDGGERRRAEVQAKRRGEEKRAR